MKPGFTETLVYVLAQICQTLGGGESEHLMGCIGHQANPLNIFISLNPYFTFKFKLGSPSFLCISENPLGCFLFPIRT